MTYINFFFGKIKYSIKNLLIITKKMQKLFILLPLFLGTNSNLNYFRVAICVCVWKQIPNHLCSLPFPKPPQILSHSCSIQRSSSF
jgi:hypothetical protein